VFVIDIWVTISNDSMNQTIFVKYRSKLKILDTCRVTCSMFHTADHRYQTPPDKI